MQQLGLRFEKNLDAIGGPHRDSGSEEVGVFGPDVASQREGSRDDRPVALVAATQTPPGLAFKDAVELPADWFDEAMQVLESRRQVGIWLTAFFEQRRPVPSGIGERRVRRVKVDSASRVRLDDLPNAASQYRPDQNIGVKHDHLSGPRPFSAGVVA